MKDLKILLTVLFVNLLLSCTWVNAKPNQFEVDAKTLCSLYDSSNWKDLPEGASGYEIYQGILGGIDKKIVSKEVKEITTGYKGADFNSYYDHVLAEMGRLLNKPWGCDHFENFYRPKVEVVSVQIDSVTKEFIDPYTNENIIISLSSDSKIFINNAQVKNTSSELLKKALLSVSKSKQLNDRKVYIHLEEHTPKTIILQILKVLSELKAGKVGILSGK